MDVNIRLGEKRPHWARGGVLENLSVAHKIESILAVTKPRGQFVRKVWKEGH
jgi:hypothetical protein